MVLAEQSDKSIMYHSVVFISDTTEINTWDNWHLIPAEPPIVSPPGVRTKYEDVPGVDSQLDLTQILTGEPLYENSTGSWKFFIVNGYRDRDGLLHDILRFIHGKRLSVVLLDEPDHTYTGRFSVESFQNGKSNSSITIKYTIDPRC